jgi:hypothetical protein
MIEYDEGYLFWKRVDDLRDKNQTLKDFILSSELNYNVVKVQRSMNRIPKAVEVCKIALTLDIPAEYLVLGKTLDVVDEIRIERQPEFKRMQVIMKKLFESNPRLWGAVEFILGIK